MKKRYLTVLVSGLGIAFIAYSLSGGWESLNRPGLPAQAALVWPSNVPLKHASTSATLLMFIHPRCDCTEASISELNEIMAAIDNQLRVILIFVTPQNPTNAWKSTGLYTASQLVPHSEIVLDAAAILADRFGAKTSGQVLLYDSNGKLIFAGGITPARGRPGDNMGKSAIISFITGHTLETPTAPVYGCVLKEYTP